MIHTQIEQSHEPKNNRHGTKNLRTKLEELASPQMEKIKETNVVTWVTFCLSKLPNSCTS